MSHPDRLAAVLVTAALACASDAAAAPPTYVRAGQITTLSRASTGRSVGSPTDGYLVGGAHLESTPYLRIVPVYQAGDVRWGLGSLVSLLDDAARSVHRQFPDAVLSVGHLSKPGGGDIDRHASHESGRDADVGFYIHSQTGRPLYGDHFVPFKGDATAPTWPGAYFDDARNWALVAALVADPRARITYIFVANPIRARLLAYAERIGAPQAVRSRAAELMAQPRGSLPHDDHFHVRIGCPADSSGCIELPTVARGRRIVRGPTGPARIGPAGVATKEGSHASPRPPADMSPRPARSPSLGAPDDHEDLSPPGAAAEDGPPAASWIEPIDDVDGALAPHRGFRLGLP
jgi:penicillin-insensitive murein endopeptidase